MQFFVTTTNKRQCTWGYVVDRKQSRGRSWGSEIPVNLPDRGIFRSGDANSFSVRLNALAVASTRIALQSGELNPIRTLSSFKCSVDLIYFRSEIAGCSTTPVRFHRTNATRSFLVALYSVSWDSLSNSA
ncbi:hypothetical protein VTO42DRAFT_4615 [Malbranchea cinnamomea]